MDDVDSLPLAGQLRAELCRFVTAAGTRRFARKQLGWFRRDPRIRWVPAEEPGLAENLAGSLPV